MTTQFRDIEDFTDSEEEIHPNIDARSYHKFRREQNKSRLEYLRTKDELTESEKKEKEKLERKELPMTVEVPMDTFRASKALDERDYTSEIIYLLENRDVGSFMRLLEDGNIDLERLCDTVYYNLSTAIKEGDDATGYDLCRIGLLIEWTQAYGKTYIQKIRDMGEQRMESIYSEQYAASKQAILNLE
ncbi:hypothetical protein ENBRE01_1849 [Enteropsectra breve]|nr:hypothetical protein ENBRE01_1849 [Enteropsectra breve]